MRLPWWLRWWRICLQCGRPGFNPWVGRIPWRGERLPTPVFWPGELQRLFHEVAESRTQLSAFHCHCHFRRELYIKCLWWYKRAFPQCNVMGLTNFKDKWQACPCWTWNSLADLDCPRFWSETQGNCNLAKLPNETKLMQLLLWGLLWVISSL